MISYLLIELAQAAMFICFGGDVNHHDLCVAYDNNNSNSDWSSSCFLHEVKSNVWLTYSRLSLFVNIKTGKRNDVKAASEGRGMSQRLQASVSRVW